MNKDEFDEFYSSSYTRLVGQLYAMIGSMPEAEDCVQEAFVRAWASRHKIDRHQAPEAWVRTTAHRLAISRWRRLRRAQVVVSAQEQVTTVGPDHVALVQALQTLPEAQRRDIVLHYIADLPISAIALETGSSETAIKTRLSRGRSALAQLLTDNLPLEAYHA